jgi:hypothetical protein
LYNSTPLNDHFRTVKSIIKEDGRNKIEIKKWKTKPLLRKMSEVEEIRSLADEDEVSSSDKESIVLGRMNSMPFEISIPQLDKSFPDNRSITSTIMSTQNDRKKALFLTR